MIDTTSIYHQRRSEAEALESVGASPRQADVIAQIRMDARSTREQIAVEADRLAEHAGRVAENARQGFTLNSLGEIQGRGQDLDRLCIKLAAQVEAATLALYPWADQVEPLGMTASLWTRSES